MPVPKELAAFAETTDYANYQWHEAPTGKTYSYDSTTDTLTTKFGELELVLHRVTGPNAPAEGQYYFGPYPGAFDFNNCYWCLLDL